MFLKDDWQAGEGSLANYKYLDDQGEWQEVDNQPVKLIPNDVAVKE